MTTPSKVPDQHMKAVMMECSQWGIMRPASLASDRDAPAAYHDRLCHWWYDARPSLQSLDEHGVFMLSARWRAGRRQ